MMNFVFPKNIFLACLFCGMLTIVELLSVASSSTTPPPPPSSSSSSSSIGTIRLRKNPVSKGAAVLRNKNRKQTFRKQGTQLFVSSVTGKRGGSSILPKISSSSTSKLPWALSAVVSVIHFVTFALVALPNTLKNFDDALLFGHCVWGKPTTPNAVRGCSGSPINSHQHAWLINWGMTAIVTMLFGLEKEKTPINNAFYGAIGFVIFSHGALHLFIYKFINCYAQVKDLPQLVVTLGYVVYAALSFAFSMLILSLGFAEEWNYNWSKLVGISTAYTVPVVGIFLQTGTEWLIPSLFAIVYPLSSITGLLSKSPIFNNKRMGWAFLVSAVVGLLEITTCRTFFQPIGGHFWYDIFLHTAMILALPAFNK